MLKALWLEISQWEFQAQANQTANAVEAQADQESEQAMSYVVTENTPGYLPESEPVEFEEQDEARVYASDLQSRLMDEIFDAGGTPVVSGSFAQEDTEVHVHDASRRYDLGRVISVTEAE